MDITKETLPPEKVKAIQKWADEVFKKHPNHTTLYATVDGNVFFEKEKTSALNHARKLNQLELIVITKGEDFTATVQTTAELETTVGSKAEEVVKPFTRRARKKKD